MSGGSYNYTYSRVHDLASAISDNGGCGEGYCAPPALRRAFKTHLRDVAAALRAIEWNDSGDGDSDEMLLISRCLHRTAELEQAIEDAKVATQALEQAMARAKAEAS